MIKIPMVERQKGAALITGATVGIGKAFVKLFTESIYLQLKGTGVKVRALAPA
jgi:short-subunit dehydrogenase